MGFSEDVLDAATRKADELFESKSDKGHRHDASEIDNLPTIEDGTPGPANVLSVGEVVTGAPGTPASVTITGESPAQTINFTIPAGKDGQDGKDGTSPPAGGASVGVGIHNVDSFAGATDADKFQAALNYVGAQTYGGVIQTPARLFNTGTRSFTIPTGTKLTGPGIIPGPKNREQGTRNVAGEWQTSCGSESASLFNMSNGNLFGITMAGLSFYGASGSQGLYTGTTGNVYSSEFNSLNFYGFKHIAGSPNAKFLNTYTHFTGVWTAVSLSGTGFTLGGSDSFFWTSGSINLGAHQGSNGNGQYLLDLSVQSKAFVGYPYITADQNFRPMRIRGGDVAVQGGVYEGYKDNDPTLGNLIRIEGGLVTVRDVRLAYGMRNPLASEHGLIEVTGGTVLIDGAKYDRGSTAATVPLVYQSGGFVQVRSAMGFNFKPTVQSVGGTLEHDSSVTRI